MRILITAGGSGGHLYPAVAIIKVLQRNRGNEIFFLTSRKGKGEEIMAKLGLAGKLLNMRGLPRSLKGEWLTFSKELLQAYSQTKEVFDAFGPEIVLGHGGYVTFPALFLAWERGIPFCLQEQNVIPGLVSKIFLKRARRVFGSHLHGEAPNLVDCGNPVRDGLWEHEPGASRRVFDLAADKFTLLVLGGSQGAKSVNQVFSATWRVLEQRSEAQVIWSTGEANYEEIRSLLPPSPRLKILPFIEEMGAAYMAADLVISRSGATTLSELNACGRPAILIPYAYATHSHQFHNAQYQVAHGAASLLLEKELTAQKLIVAVQQLIKDEDKLKQMAANSLQIGRRQAAPYIVAQLHSVLDEHEEEP